LNRFKAVCVYLSLCLCVLFLVRSVTFSSATSESDASSAMAQAEQRVDTCYSAAADAEKAGANVTGLLTVLDSAGMLLSKAQLAFQNGDFDSAYTLAVQSNSTLNGFESQADSLRDTAAQQGRTDFLVNTVGSTVGAFAVIAVGLSVWFYLKRRPEKPRSVAR
jgi:hypothetical protein